MQITVKTLTGNNAVLEVEAAYKVEMLRSMVEASLGPPPQNQRLIFHGKQLEDGHILSDYNIVDGSVIQMVLRLRD